MSTAIALCPIPQNRAGAVPRRRLQIGQPVAQPFEYSNRYWAVSAETALEVPPTAPITVLKSGDSR